MRAVVFDLWETLVPLSPQAVKEQYRRMAAHLGADETRFVELWRARRAEREIGSLVESTRTVCAELGLRDGDAEGVVALRLEWTRRTLLPRPGALDVLRELRRRNRRIGLITACTDDVEEVWPETQLASLFDATVFSCGVGVNKPDPRIYAIGCERLGVEPEDCLYVGDGNNDELRGAERVGMQAVRLRLPEHGPRDWDGAHVESLDQVLELA